jgi:outer membrane protein assembly factor BamE
MFKRALPVFLTLSLTLGGCSTFLHVYTIDINQGNVLTKDQVDKLKPGMTPAQVRYVLGTPLVADTLDTTHWDYVYSFKPGTYARKAGLPTVKNRHLTVWFANGVLARIDGQDQIPANNPILPFSKDKAVASDPL